MSQIYIILFSDIHDGFIKYPEYKFQYGGRIVADTVEICKGKCKGIDVDGNGDERDRHKVGYEEKFRIAPEVEPCERSGRYLAGNRHAEHVCHWRDDFIDPASSKEPFEAFVHGRVDGDYSHHCGKRELETYCRKHFRVYDYDDGCRKGECAPSAPEASRHLYGLVYENHYGRSLYRGRKAGHHGVEYDKHKGKDEFYPSSAVTYVQNYQHAAYHVVNNAYMHAGQGKCVECAAFAVGFFELWRNLFLLSDCKRHCHTSLL